MFGYWISYCGTHLKTSYWPESYLIIHQDSWHHQRFKAETDFNRVKTHWPQACNRNGQIFFFFLSVWVWLGWSLQNSKLWQEHFLYTCKQVQDSLSMLHRIKVPNVPHLTDAENQDMLRIQIVSGLGHTAATAKFVLTCHSLRDRE